MSEPEITAPLEPEEAPARVERRRPRPPRASGSPPKVERRRRRLPRIRRAPPSGGPVHVSVINYTPGEVFESDGVSIHEALATAARPGVTWINVDGLGQPDVFGPLAERFHLHALAIEDALSLSQRPKIETYRDHYFAVMKMIRCTPEIEEEQVSLFFGARWVITIQERADGDVFDSVRESIRKDRGRIRSLGADFLAYAILDSVVDGYFPVIETFGDRVERIEDEAIAAPTAATMVHIQNLRHDLVRIRRAVWPMREELAVLQRESSDLVQPETRIFLRDAYDHAVQSLDMIETYRETVASVMDIYLSAQNQRLNEVMKVLTVISTLFIPLTFIASIYGMNFEHMPELKWRYGYPAVLLMMVVVGFGLMTHFKRRGWW
jgi:magnesium transporter